MEAKDGRFSAGAIRGYGQQVEGGILSKTQI